ncbi:30S ribosomal protein S10 [Mesomycoplasma molare]|uniref:Small ribosomal subunit protein uS10 n=1 Tax=Mesomycoplasma molare TaxID=171288 RepID=A0ABY5TUF8_9BACT|nr:30S ribosomal protein S10 [Mesomycoplasma molare]UWD34288.1 30S ribosomal protein S10 [Mesomycoplasma molare]
MNDKLKIKLKAFDHKIVDSASLKLVNLLKELKVKFSGPVPLPTKREVFTILRSVHVNKTSREQFESRTHQRLIIISNVSKEALDKIKRLELPIGAQILLDTK